MGQRAREKEGETRNCRRLTERQLKNKRKKEKESVVEDEKEITREEHGIAED